MTGSCFSGGHLPPIPVDLVHQIPEHLPVAHAITVQELLPRLDGMRDNKEREWPTPDECDDNAAQEARCICRFTLRSISPKITDEYSRCSSNMASRGTTALTWLQGEQQP